MSRPAWITRFIGAHMASSGTGESRQNRSATALAEPQIGMSRKTSLRPEAHFPRQRWVDADRHVHATREPVPPAATPECVPQRVLHEGPVRSDEGRAQVRADLRCLADQQQTSAARATPAMPAPTMIASKCVELRCGMLRLRSGLHCAQGSRTSREQYRAEQSARAGWRGAIPAAGDHRESRRGSDAGAAAARAVLLLHGDPGTWPVREAQTVSTPPFGLSVCPIM